jgi:hypothetical protein
MKAEITTNTLGRKIMSWFPLRMWQMENNPELTKLPPSAKVYHWQLMSEFNLCQGEFYKSDLEMAAMLNVKEKTIQRARKSLNGLGLIKATSGFRSRGKGIATTYNWVKDAITGDIELYDGDSYTKMHRHTFNMLLRLMRQGSINHDGIVRYVCLDYWMQRNGNHTEFFISKRKLNGLTNLSNRCDDFSRILNSFYQCRASQDRQIFGYKEDYHQWQFYGWSNYADPREDELAMRDAEEIAQEIKQLTKERRVARLAEEKRKAMAAAKKGVEVKAQPMGRSRSNCAVPPW